MSSTYHLTIGQEVNTPVLETLDHPIPFLFFLLLALWGLAAVLTSVFKKLGWAGPASFFQHP